MVKVKRSESLAARDTYHVMSGGSQLAVKGAAPHALVTGHRIAERAPEPIVLNITRRSLFGPEAVLYVVTRDEDGRVWTNTIEAQ